MTTNFFNKLPFFPSPYPDELLFSICARYHFRACNSSSAITANELFGSNRLNPLNYFPNSLQTLKERLPDKPHYSIKSILFKHTLLPLYVPFRSSSVYESICNAITSVNRIDSQLNNYIYSTNSDNLPMRRTLHFCHVCFHSDIKTYGEPYWHRCHQVHGVNICHKHMEWLMDSEVPIIGTTFQKVEYINLDVEILRRSKPLGDNVQIKSHYFFSTSVFWLLNVCSNDRLNYETTWNHYHILLQKLGYASYLGCINMEKLKIDLLRFCGENSNRMVDTTENISNLFNWLENVFFEENSPGDISYHLLLINFFGLTCEEFFDQKKLPFLPFGSGPWPCLNPAAPHYRENVVENCVLTFNDYFLCTEGIFSCTCGFEYTKRWPYKSEEDHYRFKRVNKYGEIWENELLYLRNIEVLNFSEIGRRLGIYGATAQLHYNMLTKKDIFAKATIDNEEKKYKFRDLFINIRSKHPTINRTELRRLYTRVYTWLSRCDRAWLEENLPSRSNKVKSYLPVTEKI